MRGRSQTLVFLEFNFTRMKRIRLLLNTSLKKQTSVDNSFETGRRSKSGVDVTSYSLCNVRIFGKEADSLRTRSFKGARSRYFR